MCILCCWYLVYKVFKVIVFGFMVFMCVFFVFVNLKYVGIVVDVKIGKIFYVDKVDLYWYLVFFMKIMMFYVVFEEFEVGCFFLSSCLKVLKYVVGCLFFKIGVKVGGMIKVKDVIFVFVIKLVNDVVMVVVENISGLEKKFVEWMIWMVC